MSIKLFGILYATAVRHVIYLLARLIISIFVKEHNKNMENLAGNLVEEKHGDTVFPTIEHSFRVLR
jgi:hypothetical protein